MDVHDTLKLRISLGLEARHTLCRWREPPEFVKHSDLRPEGPTQLQGFRPFRPQILNNDLPVAHATGNGFVGPPGLKTRNFKIHASGYNFYQPSTGSRGVTLFN